MSVHPMLRSRLDASVTMLKAVENELAGSSGKMPTPVERLLVELSGAHTGVTSGLEMLEVRETARGMLDEILVRADPVKNTVSLLGTDVPFARARTIFMLSYLSATWTLADLIVAIAGRTHCIEATFKNRAHPPKLWEHFMKEGKAATGSVFLLSRGCFGLPAALSYAVRNHFVHDAEQFDGRGTFAVPTVANGYQVSADARSVLEKRVLNEYGLTLADTRAPEPWPWPWDDIRNVLDICHREMDDSLGVLLYSACCSVRDQVGLLLGRI